MTSTRKLRRCCRWRRPSCTSSSPSATANGTATASCRRSRSATGGRVRMSPGTLYGSIKRMLADGLIEELTTGAAGADERRRFYRITKFGRRVAAAEADRLPRCSPRPAAPGWRRRGPDMARRRPGPNGSTGSCFAATRASSATSTSARCCRRSASGSPHDRAHRPAAVAAAVGPARRRRARPRAARAPRRSAAGRPLRAAFAAPRARLRAHRASRRWRSASAPTPPSSASSTPSRCGRCPTRTPTGWFGIWEQQRRAGGRRASRSRCPTTSRGASGRARSTSPPGAAGNVTLRAEPAIRCACRRPPSDVAFFEPAAVQAARRAAVQEPATMRRRRRASR